MVVRVVVVVVLMVVRAKTVGSGVTSGKVGSWRRCVLMVGRMLVMITSHTGGRSCCGQADLLAALLANTERVLVVAMMITI